jgi:hypothetical protein
MKEERGKWKEEREMIKPQIRNLKTMIIRMRIKDEAH